MSATTAPAVTVAPDLSLVDELLNALGVEALRIDPASLGEEAAVTWEGDRLVWLHLVPCGEESEKELSEAHLLLASANAARRVASTVDADLVFLALVPSRGLFTGAEGLACDLARNALDGLMEARIGDWSAAGARIAGVVYAGVEGEPLDGQRSEEEVRLRTPIGRAAQVDDLADAVRFLGSPRAAYVTGTLLHVDGGWNAYSWIYPARTI